ASAHLAHLLRRLFSSYAEGDLPEELFTLVDRTRPASGWRLIEQLFPRLYTSAQRKDGSVLRGFFSILSGKDPEERSNRLRHWLLDIYRSCGWPPESFLRSLNGDTELFFRLVEQARRSPGGRDFLLSLRSALDRAPDLIPLWRRPVEDALTHR
ncbi:MAG TPA: hypothetical protein VLQ93_06550, partial [Myxococcaceae bacterium]|nr:hypothetical protein [Myxococcaceae bacterium]